MTLLAKIAFKMHFNCSDVAKENQRPKPEAGSKTY